MQYLCTCSCCQKERKGGVLWTKVWNVPSSVTLWRHTTWLSERGYDADGKWVLLRYPWAVFHRDEVMSPRLQAVPTLFLWIMRCVGFVPVRSGLRNF